VRGSFSLLANGPRPTPESAPADSVSIL
jgi:hypothetical protein